jgi:hypothetical protein
MNIAPRLKQLYVFVLYTDYVSFVASKSTGFFVDKKPNKIYAYQVNAFD